MSNRNILVINSGSSSLKYQLFDMNDERVIAKGLCDRIGMSKSFIKQSRGTEESVKREVDMPNYTEAIKQAIEALTNPETGVIGSIDEIAAVGHRVVHGGEEFSGSVVIDDKVMKGIEDCIDLAPLHNPANITGINACMELMPDKKQVAVFDTAFHQTMPDYAYRYSLPYEAYSKYKIRRYGFHGTSHKYVSDRAAVLLGVPITKLKLITCHLGNGASICAVKYGKSVDTSMGFTPLAGLAMGTRSGDLDPAIVKYLMEKKKMSVDEINNYLNKESGVLGISEVSSDFRDIDDAIDHGNDKARLALDIFCYKVKKYIGEYIAVMNGADCIVFTAGIGENNGPCRSRCLNELQNLGIIVDEDLNSKRDSEFIFSAKEAKIKCAVIATNEELAIARDVVKIVF
jgi:acetate kinase